MSPRIKTCMTLPAVGMLSFALSASSADAALVSYWDFNGGTANLVGGGPTLSLNDNAAISTAQTAPGNGGSHSLVLDGNGDFGFVDTAGGRAAIQGWLSSGNAFTLSMWARSDVPATNVNNGGIAYMFDIGSSHGSGTGLMFGMAYNTFNSFTPDGTPPLLPNNVLRDTPQKSNS